MDSTESTSPRPLTGPEPDTEPLACGDDQPGRDPAAPLLTPAEPASDAERKDGEGWMPV